MNTNKLKNIVYFKIKRHFNGKKNKVQESVPHDFMYNNSKIEKHKKICSVSQGFCHFAEV